MLSYAYTEYAPSRLDLAAEILNFPQPRKLFVSSRGVSGKTSRASRALTAARLHELAEANAGEAPCGRLYLTEVNGRPVFVSAVEYWLTR
ncbi:MAG: hypothetical protein LUE08_08760 [Akkermansiaceae bacterium]|nr:hypothetical protein [Akkermansiaceae bacterium]